MPFPPVDAILSLVPEDGVLGLGEPSHGTAEAFSVKFDVICEIARRGQLGALAFEDSAVVGSRIDRALLDGVDPALAWSDAASMWRTRTIIDGMRRLALIVSDLPPEQRPRFLGIDSKRPDVAARILLEAGLGADGPAGGQAEALRRIAAKRDLGPEHVEHVEDAARHAVASADPDVARAARQLLRRLDVYHREPDLSGLPRRELHMAETLLEGRPDRGITVVWAHTEHVARSPDTFGGPSMGHLLAEALGSRYVALGIVCGQGTCRAVDPSTGDPGYRSVALPEAHPETTDAVLARRGQPFVTSEEFQHPGPRRFVGWLVDSSIPALDRSTFEVQRPSTDVDGWLVLERSTADVGWDGSDLEQPDSAGSA